ncbi:acyltransferase family protein [Rhizobium sp. F40D2]|uniref:acyltransferase family protein n=1 Tax=Rhizobium sp. F40D2 TaxID=3453141 RepID=UPI003F2895DA
MGYIRFLLALSVVLSHAGGLQIIGRMAGGEASVQCFFMLSGFYMALVLAGNDDKATFYRNRFSRIFSGFWVASAFALVMSALAHDNILIRIYRADLPLSAKALSLFSNAFLFGSDIALFVDAPLGGLQFSPSLSSMTHPVFWYSLIPPAWSLPVELCFYLLAPYALRSMPRMLALLCASIAIRLWTYSAFGTVEPWGYRFMPSELAFFLIGAISFRLVPSATALPKLVGKLAMFTAIGLVVAFEALPSPWMLYVGVLVATPLIFAHVSLDGSRADRILGDVSYMIYLCHMAVIAYLPAIVGRPPISLAVIIAIGIAFALHRVAHPLDKWMRTVSCTAIEDPRSRRLSKRHLLSDPGQDL